ncbi:hypothetical protein BH09VER1_BH09VER1_28470 [soil metagenome]
MSSATQSDTKNGKLPLICGEDLTLKEGYLCTLTSTGALLPTAITDLVPFLCDAGDVLGESGDFIPFTGEKNHRVWAKGAGSKGDRLVLADPGTAADKGKVRVLPGATGTYLVIAIAEEDFEDGQLVKVRPVPTLSTAVA